MKDLYTYIIESEQIDEGLFKASIGLIYIKKMDPKYLLEGLLNMYNYIVDKSNIKLFYQDFPIKERPFWEFIYKLYEKKIWSIFDAPREDKSFEYELQDLRDELKDYEEEDDPRYKAKINQLKRQIAQKERSQNSDDITSCFTEENSLIDVTPEFRRKLHEIIKGSSNQEEINSANVKKIMLVNDPQFDRRYIFTINKVQGIFRNMFRAVDIKMLEKLFEKISEI